MDNSIGHCFWCEVKAILTWIWWACNIIMHKSSHPHNVDHWKHYKSWPRSGIWSLLEFRWRSKPLVCWRPKSHLPRASFVLWQRIEGGLSSMEVRQSKWCDWRMPHGNQCSQCQLLKEDMVLYLFPPNQTWHVPTWFITRCSQKVPKIVGQPFSESWNQQAQPEFSNIGISQN